MTKYRVVLSLACCGVLFCLYATLYFAWLTATPLTGAQLHRAQYDCYIWFAALVAFLLLAALAGARLFWLRRRTRHGGAVSRA